MPARHVDNAKNIVLVLAAISNKYFPPLSKDTDITAEYSKRILDNLENETNRLRDICNSAGWSSVEKGKHPKKTVDFIKNTTIIPSYNKEDII